MLIRIYMKAYELSVLTGTQVLLLVVSETGLVYTFTTPKLQPLVTKPEGKNLIQVCQWCPQHAFTPVQNVRSRHVSMRPNLRRAMRMASMPNLPSTHPKTSITRKSRLHRPACPAALAVCNLNT